jgi:hypothetical protein
VRVRVERDRDGRVTEHFRNDLRMYAATEKQAGRGVPEVVEPNPCEAGVLEEGEEGPPDEVRCLDGTADLIREHQIHVLPSEAVPEPVRFWRMRCCRSAAIVLCERSMRRFDRLVLGSENSSAPLTRCNSL